MTSDRSRKRILALPHVLIIFLIYLTSCTTPLPENVQKEYDRLPETVDYNFDVKPILSDRCYKCHGPDEEALEAGLRLDIAEQARERLESGNRAIVAGNPDKSALVHRILHTDPDERMPPAESRLSITDRERAILVKWIELGAEYTPHWSFIPPYKPAIPEAGSTWARSPIDRFVAARLERTSLAPSPAASKEIWLRRVSLDLTGLPPTIEEMDAFLADSSETAHEEVVDRLLASPHYGERMAVQWLDIARYADTHGYQDDGYRFVWPWRDWVVNAFNENMPYDEFITWQLAGDLLPDATQEQRLATTFLRNHRINSEAGIIGEEYRVEYVADRTNTVGTALLGLTLECARCHDHKYDPISQKEYYQLFSYFNNVKELGEIANEGNAGPLMPLTSPQLEATLDSIDTAIHRQEKAIEQIKATVKRATLPELEVTDIENRIENGLLAYLAFESIVDDRVDNEANPEHPASVGGNPVLGPGRHGKSLTMQHYDVVRLGKETGIERTQPFSVSLWVYPDADTGYVPIWGNPGEKNQDFRGYELFLKSGRPVIRLCHAVPHNYIEAASDFELPAEVWSHLVVAYDGSSKASGLQLYIDGKKVPLTVVWDRLYKSIQRGGLRIAGANSRGGFSGGRIDEFRYYNRELLDAEIEWLYERRFDPLREEDRLTVHIEDQPTFADAVRHLVQLRELEQQTRDTIPEIMVMEEMESPRTAYILERGVYDARTDPVSAGTPAVFTSLPQDTLGNRLGLARWLTSTNHPLTARVAVNRYWQMLFGKGLVLTPGDWGNQGALPTHPELLDWLAVRYMESGWNTKALLKDIVLSSTYRQSSRITPLHLEVDPDNRFLSRGPAFRLPAEMIRDQALAASGLLVPKRGGPPVKPYQPSGLWEELAAIKNSISTYEQDHGEKLYRRSLYTFWKRSSPPPALATFDAPTREFCQIQRQNTSTPLQALVLWNDPQFVEASRVLAERVLREKESAEERIELGFRLLTGRRPTDFERERLLALLDHQHGRFSQDASAGSALLSTGEHPRNRSFDSAELAAYTAVVQAIMSFDGAIMRR